MAGNALFVSNSGTKFIHLFESAFTTRKDPAIVHSMTRTVKGFEQTLITLATRRR
ncbi:hypothetical protein [Paracoccus beibuensis]|uniref:hypothetical protein n=1 Tax=Paracoccus beibuensis TaxID=547602 RepID=UPI00223F8BF5|nr:hypothetical protein [Paracoccus beibuensis]